MSHSQFVVFIKQKLSANQRTGHKHRVRTKQHDLKQGKEAQNDIICTLFYEQKIQSDLNASYALQSDTLEYLYHLQTHRHSMKTDSTCRNMSHYRRAASSVKTSTDVCTDTTQGMVYSIQSDVVCVISNHDPVYLDKVNSQLPKIQFFFFRILRYRHI